METETYQAGENTFIRVTARYDEALAELTELNAREGTLAENAHARVLLGKDSELSRYGNWVKEDVIYVPKKGAFLTKTPVTSESPKKAVQAHSSRREFYPTKEQTEKALANSVQIPYGLKSIPVDRFNEYGVINFGFEDFVQEYRDLLREEGIKEMHIWLADEIYVNEQDKPFARKLWFDGFVNMFALDSYSRYLHCSNNRLFGVQKDGVAMLQKNSSQETFTYTRMSEVLRELRLSGLEEQIVGALRKKSL